MKRIEPGSSLDVQSPPIFKQNYRIYKFSLKFWRYREQEYTRSRLWMWGTVDRLVLIYNILSSLSAYFIIYLSINSLLFLDVITKEIELFFQILKWKLCGKCKKKNILKWTVSVILSNP